MSPVPQHSPLSFLFQRAIHLLTPALSSLGGGKAERAASNGADISFELFQAAHT